MPEDVVVQAMLAGVWTPVPTFVNPPVKVLRGLDPYGSWPRPTRIECEINNDTLDYDPSRPAALLYGVAGRNTPIRVRLNSATTLTWGEASSWRPYATVDHEPGAGRGRAGVSLTAEGVLRRIGTWTDPLRSPMFRTISARVRSIGHWPLEDDRDAPTLENSSGGPAGTHRGVRLAEDETPQGAEQAVQIADGSQLTGRFDVASTTAGWQIGFSMKLAALPPSASYTPMFRWRTSNGYMWFWDVNNATYRINVRDSEGTLLFTNNVAFGSGADPTGWMTFRVAATASGGTVTIDPAWYPQNALNLYAITDTFAGSVGALVQWWQEGNATTAGAWFSHIFGLTTTTDIILSAPATRVFNGYLGEKAVARFRRLCTEVGIVSYRYGVDSDGLPMGIQRADTFLNLLREIVQTEDAIMYDDRSDIAITMRPRRQIIEQAAALALTFPDHIAEYEKVLDDAGTANVVTVDNASGGTVTVRQTTGPMSVSPPPAGVGENRRSVEVNVDERGERIANIADWHLAKGTLPRPRYSSVTVNVSRHPELDAAAIAVSPGMWITVDGIEPYQLRLLVVGIEHRAGTAVRTITFMTEPYEPYEAGTWDDPGSRYDARTSTLQTARTVSQTAWTVQCTDPGDVWSTGATPYDWEVAGERVTVTAMAAATGAGPYVQTCTVNRAVNGVSKAQLAGAVVQLADPVRWGL